MKNLLSILLLCLFALSLSAEDVYKIYPFSQEIEIDGKSNEKIWKQLEYSSFFKLLRGNEKPKFQTRFKAFADRDNLFLLIELSGQELKSIQAKPSVRDSKSHSFSGDQITLYFAPKAEIDDHYVILIDFMSQIESGFVPAMAGHGYPYSPITDWNWKPEIKCAFQQNDSSIDLEVKIPVSSMGLERNLFRNFGFNIQRKALFEDGKNKKIEDSCWSDVNGEIWNTEYFGSIQGPLYKEPVAFTEKDLDNLDQMTNGMTALLKSLDIYYKAVIQYPFHIPEGTEVNGDISNFDHVPMPQYPIKADGYYRFYNAFKYKPFKEMGDHIIDKLFKAFTETKTVNGKSFLLWNNLMANDGKVYSYDQGPKMVDFSNSEIPYNQSLNKFHLKDVMFIDGFGQGFLDLSEIKNSLDETIRVKIIKMLSGTFIFLHEPYMLVSNDANVKEKIKATSSSPESLVIKNKSQYFWRIDAVAPFDPKPFVGELKPQDWQYLGQDIILMFMALYNFEPAEGKKYLESMAKFSEFYMSGRLHISDQFGPHSPRNIYKLDHRMLTLAAFARANNMEQLYALDDWLKKELPKVYNELPKIDYSENGSTSNSWSTQGVLEIYRLLGLKEKYLKFWELSFDRALKPTGLFQNHRILPMNFSSYPLYLDYSSKAFESKIFDQNQLLTVIKKMFLIYGNPQLQRDNFKYSLDLLASQKSRPKWGNTPYQGYIEGVLPEGIYENGSAQAFIGSYGKNTKNEFFKTEAEHLQYEYLFTYRQYTAPFQYHSDRYSYGKAESKCLAEMNSDQISDKLTEQNEQSFTIEIKTPNVPVGSPVFGHLNITNLIYKGVSANEPTNFEINRVLLGDKELPFRVYQIFEYNRFNVSQEDRAKLVFGLWNSGPNDNLKITISIRKKQFKQFFAIEKSK